ncbi:hypothetical protein O1611_g7715 [Lasiodiplodia mahajangana]|uniref:Uncharacterized protein n=1 Tax=Lasiodiplodia mahajangana TaxID=1108764 RepID=A0ACC2JFC5_9PEZI|nr:hypothetical protein O1611_g7715 [Lasiodiplodia mahajangana]
MGSEIGPRIEEALTAYVEAEKRLDKVNAGKEQPSERYLRRTAEESRAKWEYMPIQRQLPDQPFSAYSATVELRLASYRFARPIQLKRTRPLEGTFTQSVGELFHAAEQNHSMFRDKEETQADPAKDLGEIRAALAGTNKMIKNMIRNTEAYTYAQKVALLRTLRIDWIVKEARMKEAETAQVDAQRNKKSRRDTNMKRRPNDEDEKISPPRQSKKLRLSNDVEIGSPIPSSKSWLWRSPRLVRKEAVVYSRSNTPVLYEPRDGFEGGDVELRGYDRSWTDWMALNRLRTPWAETEDWAKHRTIITDLYVKQGKRMKDVMRTMTEEYGFHATRRMYKTRFKKWGLVKNPKSGSACPQSSPPKPVVSPSMPPPKGGVGQITKDVSIPILQNLWMSSSIGNIAPPDCYRFAENTLQSTQAYFSSTGFTSLGLAAPDKKLVTATACAEWLDCMITAKALLTFGYCRQAVLLIDLCCHQYRPLLSSQDPSLMAVTITCILKVLRYWPDLAKTFLNFICTMSQIVLGAPHPLSTVFQQLQKAGIGHLAYCIYMTLRQLIGGIVHVMPHPMMDSYGDFYGDMIHGKIIDTHTILSELQPLQSRFQHYPQGQPETHPSPPEETAAIQCRIASLHYYGKRYEDATKWTLRMLNQPLVSAHVATGCYDILHDIAVAENKYDLALERIKQAVDASIEAYGRFHYSTIRKTARLDFCLRRMGRLDEASKPTNYELGAEVLGNAKERNAA